MIKIRLLIPFRCHHHELSEGEVIGVRPEIANDFVRLGMAEYAEPAKAVVEPQETRVTRERGRPRNAHHPQQ